MALEYIYDVHSSTTVGCPYPMLQLLSMHCEPHGRLFSPVTLDKATYYLFAKQSMGPTMVGSNYYFTTGCHSYSENKA
jgi:hypothetical protein